MARLVADGLVDEIVQLVKTGKEAEVYVVRKGTEFLAAKVYKERTQRNFKNNVGYMEGRSVRSSRDMRAMTKRTKYGIDKAETEWMHTEHDALVTVLHAGVRVPKPEIFYEGVLVMELVLGADGLPAPRLIDCAMTNDEALAAHHDVVSMIVTMLCCDLIHGDLSPYNVLLAWNGPTIIDMPQAVKAAHNSQAEQYLVRDVRNVTEHFAKYAPALKNRAHDGLTIWKKYMRREISPGYFPEESAPPPPKEFIAAAPKTPKAPRQKHQHGNSQGQQRPPPKPEAPPPPPPEVAMVFDEPPESLSGRSSSPPSRSQHQRPARPPHAPASAPHQPRPHQPHQPPQQPASHQQHQRPRAPHGNQPVHGNTVKQAVPRSAPVVSAPPAERHQRPHPSSGNRPARPNERPQVRPNERPQNRPNERPQRTPAPTERTHERPAQQPRPPRQPVVSHGTVAGAPKSEPRGGTPGDANRFRHQQRRRGGTS